MTRRLVLAACAWAAVLAQDPTCVDDPNWVKNGDEPWKDCAWAAEYVPREQPARAVPVPLRLLLPGRAAQPGLR